MWRKNDPKPCCLGVPPAFAGASSSGALHGSPKSAAWKIPVFRQCSTSFRLWLHGLSTPKTKDMLKTRFNWCEGELFGTMEMIFVKYLQEMRCWLFSVHWVRVMVVSLGITLTLCVSQDVEAQTGKRTSSPVQVEQVATSPNPFIIGQSSLTLSVMVKVPLADKEGKVLEVSALITSPTRRSMSFVRRRLSFDEAFQAGIAGLVPVELVWDGKDQYDRLVADGSYFYEIQAKVLEDEGLGPRTKIVSHRVQGTLEALAYAGEVLPPLPPETEVPAEIEALQQEELAVDDPPLGEDGVAVEEDAVLPGEELVGDEGLKLSGENEFDPGIPTETLEGQFPEVGLPEKPGKVSPESADSTESIPLESLKLQAPSSKVD